jgi:hypothetical protein
MAITRSHTTGKFRVTVGTPASGNFGANPAVGQLIVVAFWGVSNLAWQPQDCTDNQGNRYSLAAVSTVATRTCAIWWTIAGANAGTFTVSIASSVAGNLSGAGCATSFATDGTGLWRLDKRASATGSSTTPATGSTATLTVADEVVVAAMGAIANQASIAVESVSPAWTEEAEELSFTTYMAGEMDSRVVSATTAQSCSWTLASTAGWVCAVVTFRDA